MPDEGECPAELLEECPETPCAKAAKPMEMDDMETPPKKSDKKPKAKGKAKAKAAKAKTSPKKTPKKGPNNKKNASKKQEPERKRQRHSDEDKSFARRARPKGETACNQWLAIRDAYNKDLFATFGASHQDIQRMLSVTRLHDCDYDVSHVYGPLQESFWQHAKPLMVKGSSLDDYKKIAKKAVRDYAMSALSEPAGE